MDPQYRLQIANRIHLGLMRELGQGIDIKQMLGNALYARDVLLVCQAFPGSELHRLGEQFSQAPVEARPATATAPRPVGWRDDSSGFGVSMPAEADSGTGFDAFIDSRHDTRHAARRWLTPSTWFVR